MMRMLLGGHQAMHNTAYIITLQDTWTLNQSLSSGRNVNLVPGN